MWIRRFFVFVFCLCVSGCDEGMLISEQVFSVAPVETTVGPLPEDLQTLFFGDLEVLTDTEREYYSEYRAYYTKYIDAGGVAIIGHSSVDDVHFYNAREVILTMTSKRPELRERLTPGYKYGVAGDVTGPKEPHRFRMVIWERDTPRIPGKNHRNPGGCGGWCYATVFSGTKRLWSDYGVVVHEFAHKIHYAINDFHIPGNPIHIEIDKLDPTFQARLETAYEVAMDNAVEDLTEALQSNRYWTGDYAMTNVKEYWAEGVHHWFQYVSQVWPEGYIFEGRLHYHDLFLAKDPLLYALLDEWFPLLSVEVTISFQ